MSRGDVTYRHRWILAVGQDETVPKSARLVGIMAALEFGKPDAGAEFWPSHESLGALVNPDGKKSTQASAGKRAASALVRAGWWSSRARGGGGLQTSNAYALTYPPRSVTGDLPEDEARSVTGDLAGRALVTPRSVNPDLAGRALVTDEQTHGTYPLNIPTEQTKISGDEDEAWRLLVEAFNCTDVPDFSGDLIGELGTDEHHMVKIKAFARPVVEAMPASPSQRPRHSLAARNEERIADQIARDDVKVIAGFRGRRSYVRESEPI